MSDEIVSFDIRGASLEALNRISNETGLKRTEILIQAIFLAEQVYDNKKKGYSIAFTHDGINASRTIETKPFRIF